MNLSTGIAENGAGHTFDPNAFDEVCLELNAGDALIFTPTLYHNPNLSESARSAWSSVWAHPDSQWDPSRVPRHPHQKKFRKDAIWALLIGNVRKPDSTC